MYTEHFVDMKNNLWWRWWLVIFWWTESELQVSETKTLQSKHRKKSRHVMFFSENNVMFRRHRHCTAGVWPHMGDKRSSLSGETFLSTDCESCRGPLRTRHMSLSLGTRDWEPTSRTCPGPPAVDWRWRQRWLSRSQTETELETGKCPCLHHNPEPHKRNLKPFGC